MFKIVFMYPSGFNFIKTVYVLLITSRIYANPHLLSTIFERDMMSIFLIV